MLPFFHLARSASGLSVSKRSALFLGRSVSIAPLSTTRLSLPLACACLSSSSSLCLVRSFAASASAWPRPAVNGEAEAEADGFPRPPPPHSSASSSASGFTTPLGREGSTSPWFSTPSAFTQPPPSSSPSPTSRASASAASPAAAVRASGERTSSLSLDPESYPMSPSLRRSLRQNFSISAFFPIQAECYGPIAEGRDVIGRSKTGTGKTLAFVLPILERLQRERVTAGRGEVSVLVVEPTRELARQVVGEIEKLNGDVKVLAVYGGASFAPQSEALMRGVDICVGTPGRLMDHLDRGSCSLRRTLIVVLDEADEMLRRGFKEDIDVILSFANKKQKAQMLLFSATMPDWVKDVCREYQSNAVVVDKVTGEENSTPTRIAHIAMPAPRMLVEKLRMVGQLAREVDGRVILFVNSKSVADLLTSQEYAEELGDGVRARALHGDLTQMRRDRILADFKDGRFNLLVATDIAARGLDIPDVQLVMQLGLPGGNEFYVHRTGRTGRAGKEGRAVLLYAANERNDISGLQKDTGVTFQHLAPPRVQGAAYSALTGEQGSVTFQVLLPPSSRLQLDDVLVELEALLHGRIATEKVEKLRDCLLIDIAQDTADSLLKVLPSRLGSGVSVSVAQELPSALLGSSAHYMGRLRKMAPAGRLGREASFSSFRAGGAGPRRDQRREPRGSSSSRPAHGGGRDDRGGRGGPWSRQSEQQRAGGRERFADDRWGTPQRGEQRRGSEEDSRGEQQPHRKWGGFSSGSG